MQAVEAKQKGAEATSQGAVAGRELPPPDHPGQFAGWLAEPTLHTPRKAKTDDSVIRFAFLTGFAGTPASIAGVLLPLQARFEIVSAGPVGPTREHVLASLQMARVMWFCDAFKNGGIELLFEFFLRRRPFRARKLPS